MCPCIAQLAKVSGQPILPQSSLPTFVLAAVWTCSGCSPMFVYLLTRAGEPKQATCVTALVRSKLSALFVWTLLFTGITPV